METTYQGKQIDFNDITPGDFELAVRRFADEEFNRRRSMGMHPHIKSPHEAYGILAECLQSVKRAAKEIGSAMDSALGSLPAGSDAFSSHVDRAYSGCLDAALGAMNMAVNAQNITYALLAFSQTDGGADAPLADMAGMAEDEGEGDVPVDLDPDSEVSL